MTDREARAAASNSVAWYESMFRAHGRGGAVADGVWTCRGVAPTYYSNAVTLSPTETAAQTAALRGDVVVGGCVANRSADAVGFSNFFADDPDAHVASAVAEVARFAPGAPIVGYERGADLDRVRSIGFRAVGPLRVWIRDGG